MEFAKGSPPEIQGAEHKKEYMKFMLLRKLNKINIHLPLLSLQLKNCGNLTFLTLILS